MTYKYHIFTFHGSGDWEVWEQSAHGFTVWLRVLLMVHWWPASCCIPPWGKGEGALWVFSKNTNSIYEPITSKGPAPRHITLAVRISTCESKEGGKPSLTTQLESFENALHLSLSLSLDTKWGTWSRRQSSTYRGIPRFLSYPRLPLSQSCHHQGIWWGDHGLTVFIRKWWQWR